MHLGAKLTNGLYKPPSLLKLPKEGPLLVPLLPQTCLVRRPENAFSVAALRLWNALPWEARLTPLPLVLLTIGGGPPFKTGF